MLLTDALPGNAGSYTAVIPYDGRLSYFAKSENGEGAWSALSNNAFWPHVDAYLPLVLRGR